MAKELEALIPRIAKMRSVKGCSAVRREDGSPMAQGGEQEYDLSRVTAYLGSAAEALTIVLDMGTPTWTVADSDGNRVVILPHGEEYVGCLIDSEADLQKVLLRLNTLLTGRKGMESTVPVEIGVGELDAVLEERAYQLSLLIEELTTERGQKELVAFVEDCISKRGAELAIALKLIQKGDRLVVETTGGAIPPVGQVERILGEAVEELCRKAIEQFGLEEARGRIQRAISRMVSEPTIATGVHDG
jgi:predicted regulator of Ras-like GTPase activity (Roadblock/LC7/MglB family)